IDAEVHVGPNAVPALAREGYGWAIVRPRELGVDALVAVLDPDVVLRADSGPLVTGLAASKVASVRWATSRSRQERPTGESGLLRSAVVCFNGPMASFQKLSATGRHDLEPFWPSRQHHDFDRVCCRARNARAL
ncbi:hypothetical protein AB0L66_43305, partial [Streptomyces sp. NPDC052207]|uniref:hypothetical protein n=1 Tax=Streptomyces sp. NPDC052207 TaxID=3155418 RepID=UPI00341E266D